jgi:hypothetical protein
LTPTITTYLEARHHPLMLNLPDLLLYRAFVKSRGGGIDLGQLRGLFLLAYCEIQDLQDVGPGERLRWCVT